MEKKIKPKDPKDKPRGPSKELKLEEERLKRQALIAQINSQA